MNELKRFVFNSEVKNINEADKTLTAVVSTKKVDRMGDILEPEGVDVRAFRKNPIVLWAHDKNLPPIAKALWIKPDGKNVISKMKFASTEFAQEIFDLYKGGFMRAFSVGFIPIEQEPLDKKNTGVFAPQRYKKWELLEYSAVPVPSNPDALTLAISKGLVKSDSLKKLMENSLIKENGEGEEGDNENDETAEEGKKDKEDETNQDDGEEEDGTEAEETPQEEDKTIEYEDGLAELLAENDLLKEENHSLKEKVKDLEYKLYVLYKQKESEHKKATVDNLASKAFEIMNGVVRKAQGKLD